MKKIIFLFLIITCIIDQYILAQNFEIGIESGLQFLNKPNNVMPVLPDDFSFGSNLQIGALIKFNLVMLPIKLTGKIIYTDIKSSEFQESKTVDGRARSTLPGESEFSSSLISIQVGGEYYIFQGVLSPFINTNLQLNFIDDFKFSFLPENSDLSDKSVITRENGMRVGLGIGGGIALSVVEDIRVNINLSYNFYNLLNKKDSHEYKSNNVTVLGELDTSEKSINAIHLSMGLLYTL